MDSKLLAYYERELQYMREMGGEFAQQYPKIAGRLGIESLDCADPYVERLLEGFAFLSARVQLKIDGEVPRFTQHLMEMVYPHYLAPMPSAAIARFDPNPDEGNLSKGYRIPRNSVLRTALDEQSQTQCQYLTTRQLDIWPLEVIEASYFSREVTSLPLPSHLREASAGLRIRLRAHAGLNIHEVELKNLEVYLGGPDDVPVRLYEQLMTNALAVVVQPTGQQPAWQSVLDKDCIRPLGFGDDEALVPFGPRSFQGYRLLREYFAFPQKFLFVDFHDLAKAFARCKDSEVEIIVLFDRADTVLQRAVDHHCIELNCSPVVNLFTKRADSIHIRDNHFEHHVVPDRTQPLDYEVFEVRSVVGHGSAENDDQVFLPFYAITDAPGDQPQKYYTTRRAERVLSSKSRREGPRSSYVGSEMFISLVDGAQAPYDHDLQVLSVELMCTNRDLPLQIPVGAGDSDFSLDMGAPVSRICCIAGPTTPGPSLADAQGELLWRLINHLSLNYLSLVDSDSARGAAAIRDLLSLYSPAEGSNPEKQISGITSIASRGITRQLPTHGPVAFGRGVEIQLELDESAFKGTGCFLLAAVLEHFFGKYVSINSFTEMVLRTQQRGEIKRWPAKLGTRPVL